MVILLVPKFQANDTAQKPIGKVSRSDAPGT